MWQSLSLGIVIISFGFWNGSKIELANHPENFRIEYKCLPLCSGRKQAGDPVMMATWFTYTCESSTHNLSSNWMRRWRGKCYISMINIKQRLTWAHKHSMDWQWLYFQYPHPMPHLISYALRPSTELKEKMPSIREHFIEILSRYVKRVCFFPRCRKIAIFSVVRCPRWNCSSSFMGEKSTYMDPSIKYIRCRVQPIRKKTHKKACLIQARRQPEHRPQHIRNFDWFSCIVCVSNPCVVHPHFQLSPVSYIIYILLSSWQCVARKLLIYLHWHWGVYA